MPRATPTPDTRLLYDLILAVRGCFRRLRRAADDLHRDLGISASMRAMMETLSDGPPRTVPEIARLKGVSRQHVQVNIDALLRARLVETRDNPAHRRSPLIALTKSGMEAFREIRRREASLLHSLAAGLGRSQQQAAIHVLTELSERLTPSQKEGDTDDDIA